MATNGEDTAKFIKHVKELNAKPVQHTLMDTRKMENNTYNKLQEEYKKVHVIEEDIVDPAEENICLSCE